MRSRARDHQINLQRFSPMPKQFINNEQLRYNPSQAVTYDRNRVILMLHCIQEFPKSLNNFRQRRL